jgi:hypothetical protein
MRSRFVILAASMVLLAAVVPGKAVPLVDQGIHTYDPNTQLQWLDVTITKDVSFDDVNLNYLGSGNLYAAYRYATVEDVVKLFENAGISEGFSNPHPNASSIESLINWLGATSENNDPLYLFGITGTVDGDGRPSVSVLYHQFDLQGASSTFGSVGVNDTKFIDEFEDQFGLGSLLVRQVPLSPASPLFAVGLGVLALLRWRRKRKQAAAAA